MRIKYLIIFFLIGHQNCWGQALQGPYPDNSLFPDAYIQMRLASPDTSWNLESYRLAARWLTKLHSIDKFSLPRHKSPYSGSVFARMVNAENLMKLTNEDQTLEERYNDLAKMLEYAETILSLYYEPGEEIARFGEEELRCMVFLIEVLEETLSFMDRLEEAGLINATQAFDEMRGDLQNGHFGLLRLLIDGYDPAYSRYQPNVLKDFLPELKRLGEKASAFCTLTQRKELEIELEKLNYD